MAIGSPTVYADFSGGINKEAGPYLLQDNQCQDARNVYATPLGALEKRRGFASFSTLDPLDASAHSLAPVSVNSTKYLLAVGKEPGQNKDRIVSITEAGTATAIKSGLEPNTRWEFVQAPTSAVNEEQTITVVATGGTFTVTFNAQTTSAIAYDASAATLATALTGLSTIGASNVSVSKANNVFTVRFIGSLAGTNVSAMTANGASLTGTSPSVTVATPIAGTPQGPIYGVNGVDDPQHWSAASSSASMANWTAVDGLGNNIATHPAKRCKFLVYHLDTIWASGDPDNPGVIFSSGVDGNGVPDFRNWDSRYRDRVDPGDGQAITGIGTVGPYLLVFKNRKTYVLTNAAPELRSYRTISSSIGCVAHRSIVETAQGTMFLSDDLGVCVTDGSSVQRISDPIQPFLKNLIASNGAAMTKAAAAYYDDSYWLSVPTNGTNDITLQYSLETNSWWIHTCASNQFALLDPSAEARLYSANPANKKVERAFAPNVYQDSGQNYKATWEGPFWAWGEPHINKRLHQLRADGIGSWALQIKESFNRDYSPDLDSVLWEPVAGSTTLYGIGSDEFGDSDASIIFGDAQGLVQLRYNTPARGWGRAWSLKIDDGGANLATTIYAISAFVRTRSD